jgi:signal peptide peptidase SppA
MSNPDTTPRTFPGDEMMAVLPSALARLGMMPWDEEDDEPPFDREGPVAVVCIDGPLLQRGGWCWDGYEAISKRFSAALADRQTGSVLLKINSPGGVAAGCFEAVKALRAQASASGKRVFAYADEMACSAAYAMACIADEVWLPPSGDVGSVGVIATYLDVSKALETNGVRAIVTSTGARKADGHPMLPFSDDEIASLQARVDHLGSLFFSLVADARGMTPESVKALEAGVFSGQSAVEKRLADRVGSLADCLASAQAAASQRLSAPRAAFLSGNPMNPILQTFGLDEKATDADVVVAAVALRDQNTKLSADCAAFASRIAELEAALAASVPGPQHDAALAALQSTIDAQAEKATALEQRAMKAEALVKKADEARLTAKVESFVGPKLTPAQREPWMAIALRDEGEFDRLIALQPDLGVLGGPAIPPAAGASRSTDSDDAKVARINQLTTERMKASGESRAKAMATVMREHPELCGSLAAIRLSSLSFRRHSPCPSFLLSPSRRLACMRRSPPPLRSPSSSTRWSPSAPTTTPSPAPRTRTSASALPWRLWPRATPARPGAFRSA